MSPKHLVTEVRKCRTTGQLLIVYVSPHLSLLADVLLLPKGTMKKSQPHQMESRRSGVWP